MAKHERGQTGTTEGHAHLHEDGGTRTTVTNEHWHRLRHGQPVTSLEIPVGSQRELAEDESHRHSVES